MNTNRSTICVHEHAAERNANVCLNCKGQWERKIMNKVILMGRLTKDPDIRYSQGEKSTAVARFSLAVSSVYCK